MMEKTLTQQYGCFENELKNEKRFFLSENSNNFLETIYEIATRRYCECPEGKVLYRARKNELKVDKGVHKPCSKPRPETELLPVENMFTEGRANPYNIKMIYFAANEETAISEIRPELNYPVTVGAFRIIRTLNLVDFVSLRPDFHGYFFGYPDEEDLWLRMSSDFSKPLYQREKRINYLPTQVIAEFFKDRGFDGIVYQSQFNANKIHGEGEEKVQKNIVIFSDDSVAFQDVEVWKIQRQNVVVSKVNI